SGYRELWRGDDQASALGGNSRLGYWSWDNRWFLYYEVANATRRLFLVSPSTGEHRELTSWKNGNLNTDAAFSPDGRFVAWQVSVPSGQEQQGSRIFVIPVQGGEQRLAYEEGVTTRWTLNFMDWTVDGRYLIIASGRTGRRALHLVPLRDGQSAG